MQCLTAPFALLFVPGRIYLAVVTAALICIAVPIQLANLINPLATLVLTSGATFSTAFTKEQLDGLTYCASVVGVARARRDRNPCVAAGMGCTRAACVRVASRELVTRIELIDSVS